MSSPVDIIAELLRVEDTSDTLSEARCRALAMVAVAALTDPAIVDNAVQAVFDARCERHLSEDALTLIVETAFRSVGGA